MFLFVIFTFVFFMLRKNVELIGYVLDYVKFGTADALHKRQVDDARGSYLDSPLEAEHYRFRSGY